MGNLKSRRLTFSGVFAALIFIATFVFHIPAGVSGGYIHIGDAVVYLAACFLPRPLAFAAAAVGAGLSDLFTPGAAVWILPTVLIKPLCCLAFKNKGRLLCGRNIAALFLAAAITMTGYGIATALITGSAAAAVSEIPLFLIQSAASAVCFLIVAAALDKSNLKKIIKLEGETP